MRRLRVLLPLLFSLAIVPLTALPSAGMNADRYTNPLTPHIPGDGSVQSCADPTVIRGRQPGDTYWYMYCTTDPLNNRDTAGSGDITFHPIPMMRSHDLVHWTYMGDALTTPPSWAADGAGLWAPDVIYSKTYDRYYMTFVVTDTSSSVSGVDCTSDNAIGVATSRSPLGPWHVSDAPVIPPRHDPTNTTDPCAFFWTFDPDVLGNVIQQRGLIYYGSYYGGIFARHIVLGPRSMTAVGGETRITIGNRYEGANVVRRGDWYYLFASATNCCNGPLTGYSVFAGRSHSRLGPFVDREGNSFLAGRVGGTPVISMNGNRWVGTGHNTVFRDFDGQWWTVYHAVNRFDPYFATEPGFTKRPPLLDPLTWRHGWPSVRAGRWASNRSMPAPAAQPGEESRYRPSPLPNDRTGTPIWRLSDEFRGSSLSSPWTWVRRPADGTYGVNNGRLRFDVQQADLTGPTNNASVLTEPAPNRDYVVQTKVKLTVPAEGCCHNYAQAGLVIYRGDDRFIKLVHVSIWETRQTEFAKEVVNPPTGLTKCPYPADQPRPASCYGNTVIGAPADWTYLRIVKRHVTQPNGKVTELYTGYTSQDGKRWVRGGTWTHHLGDGARIGLVSMGLQQPESFTAKFAYVHVWTAAPLS
jgi:arabinan endo-1,5-alpha-L-arabinosidase